MSPLYRLCSGCGRTALPGDLKRGRCPSCFREWERERNSRPQHQVWNAKPWRQARAAARARDGQRCTAIVNGQRCEATTDLTVHHITPFSDGGSMYGLENLTTLCRVHHGALEGQRAAGKGRTYA